MQRQTWLGGLSKNRWDNDGTGRSIPPTAGGHIVALMTRRGGRRDSNYGNSLDKLCHPRSDAYPVVYWISNMWCGRAYPDCYRNYCQLMKP